MAVDNNTSIFNINKVYILKILRSDIFGFLFFWLETTLIIHVIGYIMHPTNVLRNQAE